MSDMLQVLPTSIAPATRSGLITVSNRLPVTVSIEGGHAVVKRSVGGLATGLQRLNSDDRSSWIGWPGSLDGLGETDRADVTRQLGELGAIPVHLSEREVEVFYEEISNGVLWPICHDRIDRLPLRIDGWEVYEAMNQRYAEAIVDRWRPGDTIWIHDYQLLRVPLLVRVRIPNAKIGFFLHVPFPNPEIFFTLPTRRWLVEGMLGADLIGFHTRRYRGHFTATLCRLFGIEMGASTASLTHDGHRTTLGVFPMGIDAEAHAARCQQADVDARTVELREPSLRLLVGVDRLDYSKGIERRLLAFEQLLTRYPEWRERVRLVQIAVPSRGGVGAYRRLRRDVESLVGRVNGEFATPTWTPVHYIHRAVSTATLLGLYRAAHVMLVTPVRDGMNLVAKEFVACRADEDGVLVLSEFAGAADELVDACIVNPYDVDGVAQSIHAALTMNPTERQDRMRRLRSQVFGHDVGRWAEDFLAALDSA